MDTSEKKRAHGVEAYLTNRVGHATGRGIAKALWHREWFRQLAAKNPELMKLASEGLVALTSMLELGGDHPIVRMANFVAESVSMENLELLKEFEDDPENAEVAKKVEASIESSLDKAEREVFLVLEHVHRDKSCVAVSQYVADTTPPSRIGGKDGKIIVSPSGARIVTTTLSSALAANKPLCGLCYPAVSVRKPEEKEKPQTIVPGRNFMEYIMRFRAEHSEDGKFQTFWTTYLMRLDGPDGTDLAKKFQEAFNGKHGYEAFRFVVDLPHRNPETGWEEWHHALDALLGKVTPADSLKKKVEGFFKEEKRQTEEMFRALFGHIRKFADDRKTVNDGLEKELVELREARKARAAGRKKGKLARRIVIVSLSVLGIAAYVLTNLN
ncbi:MAG: hypothetical protein AAB554_02130 [Patescibacteria group bacterium]